MKAVVALLEATRETGLVVDLRDDGGSYSTVVAMPDAVQRRLYKFPINTGVRGSAGATRPTRHAARSSGFAS
jgi:hypothetical protein